MLRAPTQTAPSSHHLPRPQIRRLRSINSRLKLEMEIEMVWAIPPAVVALVVALVVVVVAASAAAVVVVVT